MRFNGFQWDSMGFWSGLMCFNWIWWYIHIYIYYTYVTYDFSQIVRDAMGFEGICGIYCNGIWKEHMRIVFLCLQVGYSSIFSQRWSEEFFGVLIGVPCQRYGLVMYNILETRLVGPRCSWTIILVSDASEITLDATWKPNIFWIIWISHDGSMVLVYMLTWLGYVDGIHVTIYSTMDPMDYCNMSENCEQTCWILWHHILPTK